MNRFIKPLLVASLIINLLLVALIYHRHVYERSWTWSLASNAHAISAVGDAYFMANPNTQFVRYSELKEWDKTEWLKKNEQPERIYQPVIARGDDEVIILFEGWYGTIGLRH